MESAYLLLYLLICLVKNCWGLTWHLHNKVIKYAVITPTLAPKPRCYPQRWLMFNETAAKSSYNYAMCEINCLFQCKSTLPQHLLQELPSDAHSVENKWQVIINYTLNYYQSRGVSFVWVLIFSVQFMPQVLHTNTSPTRKVSAWRWEIGNKDVRSENGTVQFSFLIQNLVMFLYLGTSCHCIQIWALYLSLVFSMNLMIFIIRLFCFWAIKIVQVIVWRNFLRKFWSQQTSKKKRHYV